MWMIPGSVKVYVATGPVDLRAGFDRLASMAQGVFRKDPASGHLFVFLNRRSNRVKVLMFDRTGFVIIFKRLERGTFRIPTVPKAGSSHIEIDAAELSLMLEGIELSDASRRKRWRIEMPS